MRSAFALPPELAAANTPSVSATTGLGTGGGAGMNPVFSGGEGDVLIRAGSNPSAGGSVALTFPSTPPALFVAPSSNDFGTLSQATVGSVVTLTWTGTLGANGRYRIHYEWSNPNSAN